MLRLISKRVKRAHATGMKRSGWDWLKSGWARLRKLPQGTSFLRSKTGLSGGELRCASSYRDFVNVLSANALVQESLSSELGVKPRKDTIFLWRSVLGREWIFFEKWSCLLQGLNLVSRETAAGHMPCQCRSLQGGMNATPAGCLRELS